MNGMTNKYFEAFQFTWRREQRDIGRESRDKAFYGRLESRVREAGGCDPHVFFHSSRMQSSAGTECNELCLEFCR